MGQIKNIKLHIVTDIKLSVTSYKMKFVMALALFGVLLLVHLGESKPIAEVAEEATDDDSAEEDGTNEAGTENSVKKETTPVKEENAEARYYGGGGGYGHGYGGHHGELGVGGI